MNANRYFRSVLSESITPVERCLASSVAEAMEDKCEADEESTPVIEPIVSARSTLLGVLARQALIAEAELTPKPGLVDRRGSGAHTDLSLALMRRSALAIEPFIGRMALQSENEHPNARLRATLAATGRAAESAMLRVTNGSNTHKGAIWALGLLAAAAAIGRDELPLIRRRDNATRKLSANDIARTAGLIASFEDAHQTEVVSHGQLVAKRFNVPGARGEAMKGFPHIIEIGMPVLRASRNAHATESVARLDALLSIMAQLDDTCLLYRGGFAALQVTKEGAAAAISAGGVASPRGRELLLALDHRLLNLGVSPGGSADLLAGTLFLDAIERRQTRIPISVPPMITG